MAAVEAFIAALTTWEDNGKRDRPNFPARLRVKPVAGQSGVWEMTWQWPNGRATFEFGPPVVDDKVHVIWRRVGGHEILREP